MGYRCPVCDAPQSDGEHLANHLAFTAMLHGDDHERWLADRVPDWETYSPAELAAEVTDDAADGRFPQVFEDTTGERREGAARVDDHGRDHEHGSGHDHEHDHNETRRGDDGRHRRTPTDRGDETGPSDLGPDARHVLQEAMEMTRKRRTDEDAGADDADEDTADGEDDTGTSADETGGSTAATDGATDASDERPTDDDSETE